VGSSWPTSALTEMAATTGVGLASAGKRLIPSAVRRRRLAILETRNKLLLGRSALAMRRFEDAEVSRLSGEMQRLPQARVATIMPTYCRPDLLRRAVHSALAQSVHDHVIIVVDDAGGLPALPSDPRLVAVSLARNTATIGVVRNIGIRLSRSDFVAFLDDDNEWEPDHLDVALRALEKDPVTQRADLVYTAVRRIFADGSEMDVLSTPFDRKLLAGTSFVDASSIVIRRFPGLHFSRPYRSRERYPREDWEIVFRLSRHRRVDHVPVQTVRYLVNPESYWTAWNLR